MELERRLYYNKIGEWQTIFDNDYATETIFNRVCGHLQCGKESEEVAWRMDTDHGYTTIKSKSELRKLLLNIAKGTIRSEILALIDVVAGRKNY
jgi:hypothetical protein